jgi:hypothetical protein
VELELDEKLTLAAKVAVIVCPLTLSEEVVKDAWPELLSKTVPSVVTPSVNVTDPVGVAELGAVAVTVAVNVTGSPGAVAGVVGIKSGVVSGVINLEASGVEAPDWRPRHDNRYHKA